MISLSTSFEYFYNLIVSRRILLKLHAITGSIPFGGSLMKVAGESVKNTGDTVNMIRNVTELWRVSFPGIRYWRLQMISEEVNFAFVVDDYYERSIETINILYMEVRLK